MPDPAVTTQLHRETRLHFASILYFLSRIAAVVVAVALPLLYLVQGRLNWAFLAGGGLVVGMLFAGYYFTASGLRCAACSSPVLFDNGNNKHRYARRLPGLNYRARVAWDIVFGSSYQCMYCNTRYRSKRKWDGRPEASPGPADVSLPPLARPAPAGVFPESVFANARETGLTEPAAPQPALATSSRPVESPFSRAVATALTEPAAGDPGRSARPASDLGGAVVGDSDAEEARRSLNHQL